MILFSRKGVQKKAKFNDLLEKGRSTYGFQAEKAQPQWSGDGVGGGLSVCDLTPGHLNYTQSQQHLHFLGSRNFCESVSSNRATSLGEFLVLFADLWSLG